MASRYPPAFFVLITVGFLMVMSGGMANSFLPIEAKELTPSEFLVGLVVSSYHFVRLFFELPSGVVSDRVGRGKLILLGLGTGAIGAVICAEATSVYALMLGRAMWGFGASFFFLNNTTLIMTMFEPERRGKALGLFQSLEVVGNVVGQPIGAIIAEYYGFRSAFYASAILVSIGVIPVFLSKDFSRRAAAHMAVSGERRSLDLAKLARNPYLLILSGTVFIRMIVNRGITGTVFEIYLVDHLMLSLGLVGVALMIRSIGFSLTTVGSGILIDHFGGKTTVVIGTIIEAASMMLYTFARSIEAIIPIVLLDGLGSGMLSVSLMVILSNQVDLRHTGSAVGLYRTFQDAGSVVGPMLMMGLYGAFSTPLNAYVCFYFTAAMLMANIPFLLKLPKRGARTKDA